ncbi:hypothetical protein [Streptomyces sp900129855]|uniref:AlpA family transcriptional regulator n=1 Tax=Streptomyces sp. 900129855 TaxID=3155129 RepID=A0ABV2ZLN3_9ACTN
MTRDELLALPVTVDILTAGKVFGLGRNTTYDLVNAGEFPVPVQAYGNVKRVITADLWAAVGVSPE